jgi:hypothetical protein
MARPFLFSGYCGCWRKERYSWRSRAASLLELIIVLFIVGIMASLLFPALQAARSKADTVACQNNVRQVGIAVEQSIDSLKRFPQPNRWTIDCLRFMEERPLYEDIMSQGIPAGAKYPRPKLFHCAAQSDIESTVATVFACHYVLVVDRPAIADKNGRYHWELQDRQELSGNGPLSPWYFGPEISFAQRDQMIATQKGPHPSGIYYTSTGSILGGD